MCMKKNPAPTERINLKSDQMSAKVYVLSSGSSYSMSAAPEASSVHAAESALSQYFSVTTAACSEVASGQAAKVLGKVIKARSTIRQEFHDCILVGWNYNMK
mmetsp:Transcript_19403/g.35146  ORF Transcript_19403/g.35146 Transcript_19403/m.35146 type:complete len:102 (-) Transcript_19403:58-363(-)